ncbi:MAG: hypothetical protein EAY76_06145 [Alphaproteobacteria bacterium]|nr:MAG: hypothetical protein EAY76_06145 [Alphaproteobacteria bacterium]
MIQDQKNTTNVPVGWKEITGGIVAGVGSTAALFTSGFTLTNFIEAKKNGIDGFIPRITHIVSDEVAKKTKQDNALVGMLSNDVVLLGTGVAVAGAVGYGIHKIREAHAHKHADSKASTQLQGDYVHQDVVKERDKEQIIST